MGVGVGAWGGKHFQLSRHTGRRVWMGARASLEGLVGSVWGAGRQEGRCKHVGWRGWERYSCSPNSGFRFSSSVGGYGGGRCVTIVSDVASGGRVWGSWFGRVGWGGDERGDTNSGCNRRIFSSSSSEAGLGGRCGRVGWGGMAKDFIGF